MNVNIFFFFYNLAHQSNFFDHVVVFLGFWFPFIVIILAGLFLLFRKSWREFFLVFFSGGLAVLFDLILKNLIAAPRPFVALNNIQTLFPESGYAFPSGHATFFAALAVSIFFLHKKAGYIFMFFALLTGLARIIVGVHFPIDILGGFALGALVAYMVAYFMKNV